MGGAQSGLCVALFLGENGKHKQTSREISGKCRDSPGTIPNPGTTPLKICFCAFLFIGLYGPNYCGIGPLELIIVSSNFQALLFLQDKLLQSV